MPLGQNITDGLENPEARERLYQVAYIQIRWRMEFTEHQKNLIYRFYFGIIALDEGGKRFSRDYSGIRRALLRVIAESTIVDYDKQTLSDQERAEWQKMLQTFERLVNYSNWSRLPDFIFKLVIGIAIATAVVTFLVYGLKIGSITASALALFLVLFSIAYYVIRIFTWARGFSPLMLGLTRVECAFALRELINHKRWNAMGDSNSNVAQKGIESSEAVVEPKESKNRVLSKAETELGNEILRVYSHIPLDAPGIPLFDDTKHEVSSIFEKCGYRARLAEEKVIGRRELEITPQHQEFLHGIAAQGDRIKELAEHLDSHSMIGIGEPVKGYVLAPYGVMRAVLFSVMTDTKERLNTFGSLHGGSDELWHRLVAFGYIYKIAQELCDNVKTGK